MEKLSNTKAELKKSVAFKKKRVIEHLKALKTRKTKKKHNWRWTKKLNRADKIKMSFSKKKSNEKYNFITFCWDKIDEPFGIFSFFKKKNFVRQSFRGKWNCKALFQRDHAQIHIPVNFFGCSNSFSGIKGSSFAFTINSGIRIYNYKIMQSSYTSCPRGISF